MRVVVGRIGRAHGIRGDVTVEVRTDEPELRFAAGQILFGGTRTFTVSNTRWHAGKLLASFDEIRDRTAAEQVQGTILETDIDPVDLPADDDEFYDRQLIGLDVYADEQIVGQVVGLQHLGAQDVLVIKRPNGRVLVPFVAALVPEVDLAANRIVVADRPGLLDPEHAEEVAGEN